MSGKGKEKTTNKKKLKLKLKYHETNLNDKRIDLKRFAYDVIKHSALKFHVPEDRIAAWRDDSENDYGYDDFCLIVCRNVIDNQILYRFSFHTRFSKEPEADRLTSPRLICSLIQDVMVLAGTDLQATMVDEVEMSLSLVCELFIFLCSKNVSVTPKQLATIWFKSYLNLEKKIFEYAGGLQKMYDKGSSPIVDDMDSFLNGFITDHCLPYETTANNEDLAKVYFQKIYELNGISEECWSPKKSEEIDEPHKCVNEKLIPQQIPDSKIFEFIEAFNVEFPKRDEGHKTHQNTGFPIVPLYKVLQSDCPSLPLLQDPSEATPDKQTRHHKTLSNKEKMKSSSCANEEQGPGLPSSDSSGTKQSQESQPSVSVAKDTNPSYNLQGAIPKTPLEQRENTGLETIPPDEVLQFDGPSVASPQDPSAETLEQTWHLGILSVLQRKINLKERLLAGLERGPRQPNSETSEVKKSSKRKPSVSFAKDTIPFYNLPGAKPTASEGSSALQTEMPSSCSYVQRGLEQLSVGSSVTKQSSKNKSSILAADDLTTRNHPVASRQESTEEYSGSSGKEEMEETEIQKE